MRDISWLKISHYGPIQIFLFYILYTNFGFLHTILFLIVFFKALSYTLLHFGIEFGTVADFILKFQDPMTVNNIVGYLEVDWMSFDEFQQQIVEDSKLLPRFWSIVSFWSGFMLWIPSRSLKVTNQIKWT